MRIARFVKTGEKADSQPRYAFVNTDKTDGKDYLIELNGYPLSAQQVSLTGNRYPVDGEGIRLLAPLLPSKVYGVMKNYRKPSSEQAGGQAPADSEQPAAQVSTAEEPAEQMLLFTKPSTAICGPDDPIVFPEWAGSIHYEAEVCAVMGRMARNVSEKDALKYVLGYTCVNDVTAYDVKGDDPFLVRSKGFDTACPIGPWIETDLDPANAEISFSLNGENQPAAHGTTAHLLHSIAQQVSFISQFATLLPGDMILTGCADPTGELNPGDEAVVTVAGIGSLRNVVVAQHGDDDDEDDF